MTNVKTPRRTLTLGRMPKAKVIPPPLGTAQAPYGWGNAEFLTEPDSPFADGYSIEREKEALADMFEMDHPDKDPRWPRFMLLEHRTDALERARAQYQAEHGADASVGHNDTVKILSMGRLTNDDEDKMALHTKEGYRLFVGRRRDPDRKFEPIFGTMRCATACKGLFALSANDNPYADWGLLFAYEGIRELTQELARETEKHMGKLRAMEAKGLSFSVLRSASPQMVTLTFGSPYGFMVAEFTVDYDYFVRVVKTAVRKGRLTDEQGYEVIRGMTRRIRGWMESANRFHRFLWRKEMQPLCRADFLPTADEEGKKRAEAAIAILGTVPAEIFSGAMMPPHTRRKTHQITQAERDLLSRVGQEMAAADAQAEAVSAGAEADATGRELL